MARGVMALSAGMNVIRFLPPLVITREQLDGVTDTLARVLTEPVFGDSGRMSADPSDRFRQYRPRPLEILDTTLREGQQTSLLHDHHKYFFTSPTKWNWCAG